MIICYVFVVIVIYKRIVGLVNGGFIGLVDVGLLLGKSGGGV